MRTSLRSCARRQHGAFHARQALSCYSPGEVRARVAARRWLPVFGPVYRLDESEPTPRLRVAAAGLAIGHPVAACLSTAAELHGFGILDDPVTHVAVPPELPCRRRTLLWPHQLVLQPCDLTTLPCGLVATNDLRTAIDLTRHSAPPDGLAVLDAALAAGCDRPALEAEAGRHVGLRRIRQARLLLELARPGPDSPQESRLRWLCHGAGLPTPTVQLPVIGRSGRPERWIDLGWEKAKVGLEYDGETGHDGARRRRADRRRHNGLQDDDWAMFYATDLDVYRDHAALMAKVEAALRRRGMRW